MNIFKMQVSHRQYGLGTVIDQSETMIEVQFNDDFGRKKFLYPSAFESFLSLDSTIHQGEMDEELKLIRDKKEAERRKNEDDAKKRLEKERKSLFDQKRATAKRRAAPKSDEHMLSVDSRYESECAENEQEKEEY